MNQPPHQKKKKIHLTYREPEIVGKGGEKDVIEARKKYTSEREECVQCRCTSKY